LVERHHRRRCRQWRGLGREQGLWEVGGRRLTVSHPASATIDSLAGLAGWRHKQRQLEAVRVSIVKAAQSEPAVGSVLDEEVEVGGAEEDREEGLPLCCIRHGRHRG